MVALANAFILVVFFPLKRYVRPYNIILMRVDIIQRFPIKQSETLLRKLAEEIGHG
jgi:hypothetical protein